MADITEANTSFWFGVIRVYIDLFFEDRDRRAPTIGLYGAVEIDETNMTQKACTILYLVHLLNYYLCLFLFHPLNFYLFNFLYLFLNSVIN